MSAVDTSGREIVLTRLLDAPRERVWEAWTDPEQVKQWWGPLGFTTTTHSMDVRPGGIWRFDMHGPDGTDYPNRIQYLEIVEPERLVYIHSGEKDVEPVTFHTTVTFEARGDRTEITLRMVFPSAKVRDETIEKYDALEGGKQHLTRLAEHVERM